MRYLHDVWINWFEGEENGYNVCDFHEWRKDDGIELLDQVPLLKVKPDLFNFIENNLTELPAKLLSDVYQKSYLRKNHERVQLEYCFVITDGYGILAVDTIGYNIPIRKSRLIPRQEQLVYDLIEDYQTFHYEFKETEKEYDIYSPDPAIMIGLTRKERNLKQLLFMALDQLRTSENEAEVRYWYTEWNPERYSMIQRMAIDDAWEELYKEIKKGWTQKHMSYCERIIKGQPFFEKLWSMECGTKVN